MAYKITDGCIGCGACEGTCPVGAISNDGKRLSNRCRYMYRMWRLCRCMPNRFNHIRLINYNLYASLWSVLCTMYRYKKWPSLLYDERMACSDCP